MKSLFQFFIPASLIIGLFLIQQNGVECASAKESLDDSVTSVSQLTEVRSTDWAFQALESLIEQYHCITGYVNQTFQGNRALSRYEFAVGLNACLDRVNQLIASSTLDLVKQQDLQTLRRLEKEFGAELATLRGRVDTLEVRTTTLESEQFSTTTQLRGQAILAVTAGGFTGNDIISPTGAVIADKNPSATFIYRVALSLNTSFYGTDQLQVRLTAGSEGADDNTAGLLEPNFASALDFSVPGRPQFALGRLFYTFNPTSNVSITLGPRIVATDYVDRNRYANTSYLDFSTQALVNNFVLFTRPAGAGAVIDWHPTGSPFKLRGLYVAGSSDRFNTTPDPVFEGPRAPALLFPTRGGKGGLWGDPYESIIELEYSPSTAFVLRLQYANGIIFGSRFNAFGANFELAFSPKTAIFGRYGYGIYLNSTVGDVRPNYWMAGLSLRDVFRPGAVSGIAVGQPFIEGNVGNATQTNFEAFYNFPINDNLQVTPLIQMITNAGNQDSNGTIVTGTIRMVILF